MSLNLKFRMTNIGAVKQADIELGDFTIIAGRNNTGKTHIVYAIYGFLRGIREIMSSDQFARSLDTHFRKLASLTTENIAYLLNTDYRVEWECDDALLEKERDLLLEEMTRIYSKSGLSNLFSVPQEVFGNASFELDLNKRKNTHLKMKKNTSHTIGLAEGDFLSFRYDGVRISISLTRNQPSDNPVSPYTPEYIEYLLNSFYPSFLLGEPALWSYVPFILSTQRYSVSLFYKELDSARSEIVRLLLEDQAQEEVRRELQSDPLRRASRLSLPIHDNIDFARRLPGSTQHDYIEEYADLIADLVRLNGGQFEVKNRDIIFTSSHNEQEGFEIPLHFASSSAGEMSLLYFFLTRVGFSQSHLIIVDEPECHLDTANQIQFARILARLVNSGAKVLITTHSDYIIKEVNNLIMLSSSFTDKAETVKHLGYREGDYLNPDSVRAYVAEDNGLTPCPRDRFGMIDFPLFDKTINDINRVSNSLYAILNEEQEEE